ncbi:MAG: phospholipid carrier-dependent glycosyltransferase [Pseudomonadota bacterium]|nr:phospholipid carrier-dependent glycosyltransferase [Pseudomonadota bacterium]
MKRFGKTEALTCLALFLLALGLRLTGLDYGYFHGDERVNDAAKVLTGQLIPGQHFYPPFINYLNAVALVVLFAVGLVAGWWDSAGAFRDQYFADPTAFYLATRAMTALWGAGLAVLFFLAARQLRLTQRSAIAIGLLGAFFPLAVFMSHISKGDAGLATAMMACIWAMLMRMDDPRHGRWDLILGLSVTLALSFKHSAIFVLLPMGLGWLVLLAQQEGTGAALKSFARVFLLTVGLWPIFNIGVLLDFQNFLEYQRIQSVMSVQGGTSGHWAGITTLIARSFDTAFGMTAVMASAAILCPILILTAPRLSQKGSLLVIWLALTIGTLATAWITGSRQPEHLWIANFAGYLFVGAVALAAYVESGPRLSQYLAASWLAAGLGLSIWGSVIVLTQATAMPVQVALDHYLAENHADRRILTAVAHRIPQQKEAQAVELQRIERLASKYKIDAPEVAEDRIIHTSAEGALFYVHMPVVMFGLESVDEGQEGYSVKAHTWPLQAEEWQRAYWLDQGFSLFVVEDFANYAHHVAPEIRRQFLQALDRDCAELRRFDPSKPLFLEREVRVYDCGAGS